MSKPGQLGHGRPPGSSDKQLAAKLADLERALKENTAMTKRAIQLASSALTRPDHLNASQTGITFSTTFTDYPLGTITVPDGFTGFIYWISAAAGATFSAPSSLSVRGYASSGGPAYGDAIASGTSGGALSVSAPFAQQNGIPLSPGDVITFGVNAAIVGSQTAGSGNVHISVAAIFTR